MLRKSEAAVKGRRTKSISTECTFKWNSEFEPWECTQTLGPLIIQTRNFAWINSVALPSCIWVWIAEVWVQQGKYSLGAYMATYWDLIEAPTWSWESLLSLDQRKKTISFLSDSILSKSPVNHFFNIQSSRTGFVLAFCMGEWFLFLMFGSQKYGFWHYQGKPDKNLHDY